MSHDRQVLPIDDDSDVLVFETSPYGNLDAIVQQDGRAIYFFLNSQASDANQVFGTRACWVRNLHLGPYVLNEDEMQQGLTPMLPRTHCKSLEPGQLPCPDDLRIVWFEEGNGAALTERSADHPERYETLAVIPPWSGTDGFLGYAAECAGESPLCWPLPDNPNLQQRIDRADEFWNSFSSQPDPFSILQPAILGVYDRHFGETRLPTVEPDYFAIDGGDFPPRGLVHYRTKKKQILATVAMSLCPQPAVELFTDNPQKFRRIELAIELPREEDPALVDKATKAISKLAGYPWRQFNWLGDGHSCQFSDVMPGIDSVLLVNDLRLHAESPISFPRFREDPIQLLWLLPLPNDDHQALTQNRVSADQLIHNYLSTRSIKIS